MRALQALGETQHVDGAVNARLRRLNWIVLVVHGRSRAREIVDLINLDIEREGHVVAQEFEVRRAVQQMRDVALAAREQIVGADNIIAAGDEAVAKM